MVSSDLGRDTHYCSGSNHGLHHSVPLPCLPAVGLNFVPGLAFHPPHENLLLIFI